MPPGLYVFVFLVECGGKTARAAASVCLYVSRSVYTPEPTHPPTNPHAPFSKYSSSHAKARLSPPWPSATVSGKYAGVQYSSRADYMYVCVYKVGAGDI